MGLGTLFLLIVFLVGYCAIILEYLIRINKAGVALFVGVACWVIYFFTAHRNFLDSTVFLSHKLGDIAQILFFLLGAMTLVELIDSHKGFNALAHYLQTRSRRKMLWLFSVISFFLSAVIDNLTTTILMISILRKLVPHKKERFLIACMVIVAANAGGAWTPIGDVTTTMLWINGQISTLVVMKELFIPSLISLFVPLVIFTFQTKGIFPPSEVSFKKEEKEPGAKVVFSIGILGLLFVPIFKWVTGAPPFMGMLIAVAVLWIITDIMHYRYENRTHLRVPFILSKIDIPTLLFFLGILLSVSAIEATSLLEMAAQWLNVRFAQPMIATFIGLASSVVDNVPLVAATMGMYDLQTYPTDSPLWMMIAYAAGVGGSLLVMGSSAGVALMGMENVSFYSYLKKMTLPVFFGYVLGLCFYVYTTS